MRVFYTFIHGLLFLLRRLLSIDTKRSFASFPTQTCNIVIIFFRQNKPIIGNLKNKLLDKSLGDLGFQYAQQGRRLSIVLDANEIQKRLSCLNDRDHLIFSLLYGLGLRISECLRVRIQDINLERGSLSVRCSKGNKERTTILIRKLTEALNRLKRRRPFVCSKIMKRG
ncbi:tyrosine-type recombinase/integrase [Marinomonas sp. 2405UD68-3]|uniref:tyrosine-type recombinase/integrase n=1 Tax=Marinomonas sp. 2405UD68-3 TaxID=3391835 RepID=UPI0039C9B3F5